MKQTKGIEKIIDKWRGLIKSKKRAIISFEEIIQGRIESLKPWIYPDSEPLEGWTYRQFKYDRHGNRTFVDDEWRPIRPGDTWGGEDMSAYFRCKASIPERFRGRTVVLKLYFSGDGLLRVNGDAFHGLDPFRDTIFMTENAQGDECFDLEAESYIMWHFGEGTVKHFEISQWAVFDRELHEAYWDLKTVFNLMMSEKTNPDVVNFIRKHLDDSTRHIDQRCEDGATVREMAVRARKIIREKVYSCDSFRHEGLLHLTGNSHLDLVYLWTHAEFIRKIGRSHATALRLMERYPEYIFTQSQPHMYDQMKRHYPELFEQVKRRIAEGRWEAIGAFWVEPDCNLISGESMVRQIMHGVAYYQKEFGVTPRTAWIPDVFGNAWTMPQILVKCGLEFFVTHKMSIWNDTNAWTKNVFWWEGPDGSRIFSHVPTTHFIGTAEPDHLQEHWERFSDKVEIGESLYCYGWGDGGGGPDAEMLEYCCRYRSLPGLVPCRNSTVEDALESMRERAENADIPVINDELYLEEHRGVNTTKGRLKKLNRYCEHLYRKAELFNCFCRVAYPAERLRQGWREVLVNQFHDSLPGTHDSRSYLDILESYDRAVAIGRQELQNALEDIISQIDTDGPGRAAVIFNSLPAPRDTRVSIPCELPAATVLDRRGNEIPCQFSTDYQTHQRTLEFEVTDLPPVGYEVYHILDKQEGTHRPRLECYYGDNGEIILNNEHIRAVIDQEGCIASLTDKSTGREFIDTRRRANVFKLYEDIPGTFDAWDIEEHYTSHEFDMGTAKVAILEQGPVKAVVEVNRCFRNSQLRQQIVLGAQARRLDFCTWVDWKEQRKLLKVRFHTNIRSRTATYDIPYGNIERPTTRNNSYEAAKFEVPGHEWMDLSQADRGLSLLTDSKYGYEALGCMISLSLLKGPLYPDPTSDQEEHYFTYSLYPHADGWRRTDTIGQAADLNDPVEVVMSEPHTGQAPTRRSFLRMQGEGVTLEAVKQAENADGVIVRVVERHGGEKTVTLELYGNFGSVCECDLLERDGQPLSKNAAGKVSLAIRPYEIKTLRFTNGPAD